MKKIISNSEIENLKVGAILIKYPVRGEPKKEIDLLDTNNILRYEVHSISGENIELTWYRKTSWGTDFSMPLKGQSIDVDW